MKPPCTLVPRKHARNEGRLLKHGTAGQALAGRGADWLKFRLGQDRDGESLVAMDVSGESKE